VTLYAVDGVSAQGNETVIFVPTLAIPTAPTVAELTGASALNLGYALRGFSPNSEQGTSEDIRLASTQTFENPGRVRKTLDDITYVYDPQAAAAAPMNKHYETLRLGVKGFMVDRRGIPATTAVIAAQKVDVYQVQLGDQRRVAIDPSAEGGKFEIIQKPFVVGLVREDATVTA
jgi:hypothetical protein